MHWHGPRYCWRWVALAAVVALASERPANAFYWYGWPGSGLSTPVPVAPKSLPPGERTDVPPDITPTPPDDVPTEPKAIPEPGTLLATGIGLATVGFLRRLRQRRKSS